MLSVDRDDCTVKLRLPLPSADMSASEADGSGGAVRNDSTRDVWCVVQDSNSGHQLLVPPANWCPMFAPYHAGIQSKLATPAATSPRPYREVRRRPRRLLVASSPSQTTRPLPVERY